jgi:hypothetical protein
MSDVNHIPLPKEIQHSVVTGAVEAAMVAVRNGGEDDPVKAARQVAEAAVAAWQIVNGVIPSLSPRTDDGTRR